MTEESEASVLTAGRAQQHVRLSTADDAYKHLCILTVLSSLGPLHLMLAATPVTRGFGAALASVGALSKGSRTVRCLPALPCRLRAMGPTVWSSSSSPDNHFQQLYSSHSDNPVNRDLGRHVLKPRFWRSLSPQRNKKRNPSLQRIERHQEGVRT
jgi:hypothetical protein